MFARQLGALWRSLRRAVNRRRPPVLPTVAVASAPAMPDLFSRCLICGVVLESGQEVRLVCFRAVDLGVSGNALLHESCAPPQMAAVQPALHERARLIRAEALWQKQRN